MIRYGLLSFTTGSQVTGSSSVTSGVGLLKKYLNYVNLLEHKYSTIIFLDIRHSDSLAIRFQIVPLVDIDAIKIQIIHTRI